MAFYLGIDAGGTRTRCAAGDGQSVIGAGLGGGANIVRVGAEQARAAIQSAIRQACAEAKVPPTAIAHTCIGAAGISSPGVSSLLRQFISEVVSGPVAVVGDHDVAFEAALGDAPGVIVVAGTGSVAFGRNAQGHEARAGGYGFAISDEGSGQWIGRTAVSQVLRALDRGAATPLHGLVLEAWKIAPDALVKTANAIPPPDFSRLCSVVVQVAEKDDPVATSVLRQAGAELAELAASVLDRLWQPEDTVRVAMVGGVFTNSAIVREYFALSLRKLRPSAIIPDIVPQPVLGALSLATKRGVA